MDFVKLIVVAHIYAVMILTSMVTIDASLFNPSTVFAQSPTMQSPATTEPFVMYNNSKYPFTLQYPQNWKIKEDQKFLWFIPTVEERGGFRIEYQSAYNQTLSNLVEIQLNQLGASLQRFQDNRL